MQKIIQDRNKKLLVDVSANRITLLDGRFYYTDEKEPKPVPSVTTILNCYPKDYGFYKWLKENGEDSDEIMNEAGRRGSRIHDMTDRYDKGEKIELLSESGLLEISMNEWQMFERYVDFTEKLSPEHFMIEQNHVSTKLNCAGTKDRGTVINGQRWLIDIKTGPNLYDHMWLQVAAYANMDFVDNKIKYDRVGILHLNGKTRTEKLADLQGIGWKLIEPPKPLSYYWELFQTTQKLWYALNGDLIPKNLIYQLAHQKSKSKPVAKKKK